MNRFFVFLSILPSSTMMCDVTIEFCFMWLELSSASHIHLYPENTDIHPELSSYIQQSDLNSLSKILTLKFLAQLLHCVLDYSVICCILSMGISVSMISCSYHHTDSLFRSYNWSHIVDWSGTVRQRGSGPQIPLSIINRFSWRRHQAIHIQLPSYHSRHITPKIPPPSLCE